jgi:hypothetical protein
LKPTDEADTLPDGEETAHEDLDAVPVQAGA